MSDLEKASQAAVDAARQSEQFAVMLAAITAAQAAQPPACQHPAPVQSSGSVGKWLAIGAGGSVLLLTVAISAIAVAVGAVSVALLALVLRSIWRDIRKG